MKRLNCFVLPLLVFQVAYAQSPAYTLTGGTHLQYREISRATIEVSTPQGDIPVKTFHDATINVQIASLDTAKASYSALELSFDTPQGKVAPDTDPVIGEPFVLYFPANGRVQTIETPAFPDSFEGVTDLRWQFWDFFLPLPNEPLVNGLVWTDTMRSADGEAQIMQKIARYKVVGDTVIVGMAAKIVASEIESKIEASGEGPAPGLTAVSRLEGTERGEFYFSLAQGRFVGRKRAGDMRGEIRYEGGPQPMVLPQRMRYESTIELLNN